MTNLSADIPGYKPPEAEKTPNGGLSVNGSELQAIANLEPLRGSYHSVLLRQVGDAEDPKSEKRRRETFGVAYKATDEIRKAVFKGDKKAIKERLQTILAADPSLLSLIGSVEGALERDIPIEDVLRGDVDTPFSNFVRSLDGRPLDRIPRGETTFYLTELGVSATASSRNKTLSVYVVPEGDYGVPSKIDLPLNKQRPVSVAAREIVGAPGKEIRILKTEVLNALQKRHRVIGTHVTSTQALTSILDGGHMGLNYGYHWLPSQHGLFIAGFSMDRRADQSVSSDKRWPAYIEPDSASPFAIFPENVQRIISTARGTMIDGGVDLTDTDLIGIWVTPTYKKHLLNWIGTWTEEKRQRVFGKRDPSKLLISSAKDVDSTI